METKRILLVDNHIVVLKGLQLIVGEALDKEPDIDLATSGKEALRMLRQQPYDICILEIDLPDVDGIRMLRT
ncbi:MAG: response regulator, partial [Muribaculaceae bacterium]|nr:response regulator [Muribaculaceae bacterium]